MSRPSPSLRLGLLALALCGALPAARAATLNVPTAQYPTIQAGINAALPGDTVLIADGTYTGVGNYNLDFKGKAITVTSQHGAARTIIDPQGNGRGAFFHSGETAAARLQGLTIEKGIPNVGGLYGGGLYIGGSSPTIAACVFTQNQSLRFGGGLYANITSAPTITGCAFAGNNASDSAAGGGGGGLFLAGSGTVTGCTFTENVTSGDGGGLSIGGTLLTAVVSSCTFSGNTTLSGGSNGGGSGGGISVGTQAPGFSIIQSCVFVGNQASSGGGVSGKATVINCSFYGNQAFVNAGVSLTGALTNCILEIDPRKVSFPVTYCDLLGAYNGLAAENVSNVSMDPQYVRTPNLSATPIDYGDLHLRTASGLVHIGTGVGAPATDAGGAVRPATPSIGAYETGPALLPALADAYVLSSTSGQNFGSAPALSVGGFLGAAYLRFDLSSLGPLTAGSTAKLRLNAGRALPGTANLVVSATGTAWTEAGLTFQTRPPLGLPLGFATVTADGLTVAPYDVDITPYVKAQQALGINQIGLALTQLSAGLPVSIHSKENPANDGPQLVVTY